MFPIIPHHIFKQSYKDIFGRVVIQFSYYSFKKGNLYPHTTIFYFIEALLYRDEVQIFFFIQWQDFFFNLKRNITYL